MRLNMCTMAAVLGLRTGVAELKRREILGRISVAEAWHISGQHVEKELPVRSNIKRYLYSTSSIQKILY